MGPGDAQVGKALTSKSEDLSLLLRAHGERRELTS